MDINKIIERAKNILLTPKTEWPVISGETTTTGDLYKNYVLILAAVPALASFLGLSMFGAGFGMVRFGVGFALSTALFGYLVSLVAVYIYGLVINGLAPTFGGQKDPMQALKVAVYASTASWIAGIGALIPGLGWLLSLVGVVFTIYLLYLGLPVLMKCPEDKAVGYTAVSIIVGIVVTWVLTLIVGLFTGAGMLGSGLFGRGGGGPSITIPTGSGDVKIDGGSLGKLEEWGKQVEAAGKKMEAAEKSGDQKAQGEALGGVLGAVLGGAANTSVESLGTDTLKGFLPATLGGLPRKSMSAERNQAMGLQISEGKATYGSGEGPRLELEIQDMGGTRGVMMFAGWAALESEKQTDTGYEKTTRQDGRMVHEEWDSQRKTGEFSLVLGERFLTKVSGSDVTIDQIKAAMGELNLAGLEALKNQGVKAN